MRTLEGKTAVLYSRVSTKEQKESGHSLKEQGRLLQKFCDNMGMSILECFEDDHSAKTFDRPAFNKLIEYSKKNKPDYVLFYRWDRFSREVNGIEFAEEMRNWGVEPNSIQQWLDYEDPSSIFLLGIYIIQGTAENRIKSLRTKIGTRGALKEGRYVNKAPIGYNNGKDLNSKKKLIFPCPEKSPLVLAAFKEYSTGLYTQETVRKKYFKLGLKLGKSQFSNMLSKPIYIGKLIVPEYKEEPEQIVNALHKAIVDEVTFLKVQKVKFGKSNIRLNVKKSSKHEEQLPLRGGILKCSKCGSNLTGSPSKSRNGKYHYYYHCNPRKRCKERFSASLAHNKLLVILQELKPPVEVVELFKAILIDEYKISQSERINNLKRMKINKKEAEDKLDNLTEKYTIDNSIDRDSYIRVKIKIKIQIDELILKIEESSNFHKDIDKFVDFGIQLLANIDVFYKNSQTEIKRKIIGSIFSDKLIFENKKYRTTKFNDAVTLIFNNNNGLQTIKHKKRHSISKVSYSVAGAGLEPATFGL